MLGGNRKQQLDCLVLSSTDFDTWLNWLSDLTESSSRASVDLHRIRLDTFLLLIFGNLFLSVVPSNLFYTVDTQLHDFCFGTGVIVQRVGHLLCLQLIQVPSLPANMVPQVLLEGIPECRAKNKSRFTNTNFKILPNVALKQKQ